MNAKKGSKIKAILKTLAEGALPTAEILDEMWPVGFTRSHYVNRSRRQKNIESEQSQKFYALLNYLKSEGFIEKKKVESGGLWKITSSGLTKLRLLKENTFDFQSHADTNLKIIVFDVPEKERRKRAWLREALRILGFKMLQQSVWIGKYKIPEQFLIDLKQKNLLPYIHIMEVTRGGTVKELS